MRFRDEDAKYSDIFFEINEFTFERKYWKFLYGPQKINISAFFLETIKDGNYQNALMCELLNSFRSIKWISRTEYGRVTRREEFFYIKTKKRWRLKDEEMLLLFLVESIKTIIFLSVRKKNAENSKISKWFYFFLMIYIYFSTHSSVPWPSMVLGSLSSGSALSTFKVERLYKINCKVRCYEIYCFVLGNIPRQNPSCTFTSPIFVQVLNVSVTSCLVLLLCL